MKLILLFLCFISCSRSEPNDPGTALIDPELTVHPIYAHLDKQKENLSMFEIDPAMKKTSDVLYVIANSDERLLFSSKYFNCRSYVSKSDSLTINVGISTGFSGNGFTIYYNKGKFNIKPYSFTDVIYENEPISTFEIQQHELTLNQREFKQGDSLYGKVYFHITETKDGVQSNHFAEGYFRSTVKAAR